MFLFSRRVDDDRVALCAPVVVLICLILGATTAVAFEAPPCAPPGLVTLDPATAATLNQVVAIDDVYELHFASTSPDLTMLSTDSILLLPPTSAVPGGLQGPILSVVTAASTTTVTVLRSERWSDPVGAGLNNLIEIVVPDTIERVCQDIGVSFDEDGDSILDSGSVDGQCVRDNGGEHGFELQIVDGVTLNGLVSVAPFDIATSLSFADEQFEAASFLTTGRISFSGELRATTDASLNETRPISIGSFLVATHLVEVPGMGTATVNITADVYAGACGNVTAGMSAGLTSTGTARLGMSAAASQNPLPVILADLGDSTIDVSPPQLAGDTPVDVTLYGGALLRANFDFDAGGVIPVAGGDIDLTARGSVRLQVDPNADPWWTISGRPEVYVDLSPELLTVDLTSYRFDVINPPPTTFFTSNAEFPFTPPNVARTQANDPQREAGSALRWSRVLVTEDAFSLTDLAPTDDGGALAVGSGATGLLVRTDYRGNRMWQRRIEGGVAVRGARQLSDGSFLVAGLRGGDVALMRVSDQGELLWARRIETTGGDIQSVVITRAANGEVRLGGEYLTTDGGNEFGPWAASVLADGTVNWLRRFGVPGVSELIHDVVGLADGGLMLVGQTPVTPAGPTLSGLNAYTLRLSSDGNVMWSHVWASSTFEQLLAAHQAPDGSFLVAGETGGTNLDSAPRGLIIRFDEDAPGAPTAARWVRAISGSRITAETFYDRVTALTDAKDGFIVAGSSGLGDERTAWLARLVESNQRVDLVWSYFHDGLQDDRFVTLKNLGDGVLAGGNSRSFADNNLNDTMWLTRAPLNGFAGWNDLSGAAASPTALVLDEPIGYPSFVDELNITAEAMLTDQEQAVDVVTEVTVDELVFLTPIAISSQELIREPLPFIDSDADGIEDALDNCTLASNPDQRDSNADGFGNLCDADLNDDGITNVVDLGIFRQLFFTDDANADLDGDGVVNVIDLGLLRQLFFAPPGPSGLMP